MSSTKKQWRLNYYIAYRNKNVAKECRGFVHQALTSAATVRRIDFSIECDRPMLSEVSSDLSTSLQGIVADLVYFRSSPMSLSSIKEFRSIVDQLFQGYDFVLKGVGIEIGSQMMKELPKYPFPEKSY